MTPLSDKETTVLNQISRNSLISQRELARSTGISLGLVNIILKKLLKFGHLQVSNLDKRKLEYLLTPRGLAAATHKVHQYATETIKKYRNLQGQLRHLFSELHESGFTYLSIHGDGELRDLIESQLPIHIKGQEMVLGDQHCNEAHAAVLNVTAESPTQHLDGTIINVLDRLDLTATWPQRCL